MFSSSPTTPEEIKTLKDSTEPGESGESDLKDFDDILKVVGSQGKYQRLLLYAFLCPLTIIEALLALNEIFMLYEPDHWCATPDGSPATKAWKNSSIPQTTGWDGLSHFSKCAMFNETGDQVTCTNGWEYDTSDYDFTIPSQYNWVCSNSWYATHVFTIKGVGSLFGAIILGRAADVYGRKPIFFLTVLIKTIFRFTSLYFAHNFTIFLALNFMVGTAFPSMFLTSTMIVAEYCDADFRAWTYAFTWMIWVVGMAFMPFLAWITRHWYIIGLTCSLAGVPLLLYYPFLPESARWLITQGKSEQAVKVVMNVSKVNGTNISEHKVRSMIDKLVEARDPEDKNVQSWTLLSRKRLAKNTLMICTCWAMNGLVYGGLTLNSTRMAGNQFLNFFLMALIELPSGYLGGKLVDITGRRWTQVGFFAACSAGLFAAAFATPFSNSQYVVVGMVLISKFAITLTFLVVYLQATEIFPTNLRSTGSGLASTVSIIVGTSSPAIVALGKHHSGLPYFILALLAVLGTVAAAFLPETLHQKLPETIEDANNFGKGNKFWSYKIQKFIPQDKSDKTEIKLA